MVCNVLTYSEMDIICALYLEG